MDADHPDKGVSFAGRMTLFGSANWSPWPESSFCSGAWLEAHVYLKCLDRQARAGKRDRIVRTSLKIRDVAMPERAGTGGQFYNDYELDLIVVGPGAIHLVECKTGKIERSQINLLEVLRARLQGQIGISMLVGRDAVQGDDTALGQRARAANVTWVQASADGRNLEEALDRIFA